MAPKARLVEAEAVGDRVSTTRNLVAHLGGAVERIQYRQTAIFFRADEDYGRRVAEGLGLDLDRVKELAAMSIGERAEATMEKAFAREAVLA